MKQRGIRLITDSEAKNEEFGNILDALKDMSGIYEKTEYHLDKNIVLAEKPEKKMQDYITRQKIVAMAIANSFPTIKIPVKDKTGKYLMDEDGNRVYEERLNPYAKKTHDLIMSPVYAWCLMNRNTKANVLLMGILNFNNGTTDLDKAIESKEEPQGVLKRISNYFRGKDKNKEKTIVGGE